MLFEIISKMGIVHTNGNKRHLCVHFPHNVWNFKIPCTDIFEFYIGSSLLIYGDKKVMILIMPR